MLMMCDLLYDLNVLESYYSYKVFFLQLHLTVQWNTGIYDSLW